VNGFDFGRIAVQAHSISRLDLFPGLIEKTPVMVASLAGGVKQIDGQVSNNSGTIGVGFVSI
jgi:hypothetical protein